MGVWKETFIAESCKLPLGALGYVVIGRYNRIKDNRDVI